MLWILGTVMAVTGLWYWFEGRWDRRLFTGKCRNLNAAGAEEWLREHPETQVLDVRSAGEFAAGALPGAVNIPIGDEAFVRQASALERSRPVLVYCAGGFRSRRAVAVLKQLGFENIQHMHRGYMSWKHGRRGWEP